MRRRSRTLMLPVAAMLAAVSLYFGCRTTPVTERKQLLLMPESQEIKLGLTAFDEMLAEETPSANSHYIEMVNRVGQRIAAVADRPQYDWEFRVIASEQQNAFALPGGKVAVYEGILPICANEAGLAVVMSHEVAHALARHGGERMSHGMVVNGAQRALDFMTQDREKATRERLLAAYGIASKYGVVLPYNRKQESEADHIGVLLMAKAGYDPREAPLFWERFSQAHAGQETPEFLSTHPSDAKRAENLRKLLPEASELYAQAPTTFGFGEPIILSAGHGQLGPSAAPAPGAAGNPRTGFHPGGSDPFQRLPAVR